MSNRYTIDSTNFTVEIFNDAMDVPLLRQPTWPDGTAWGSLEAAESWAQSFIESMNDDSPTLAPDSPGTVGKPKPSLEDLAKIKEDLEARIALELEKAKSPEQ